MAQTSSLLLINVFIIKHLRIGNVFQDYLKLLNKAQGHGRFRLPLLFGQQPAL
jgi:hypothetical protein